MECVWKKQSQGGCATCLSPHAYALLIVGSSRALRVTPPQGKFVREERASERAHEGKGREGKLMKFMNLTTPLIRTETQKQRNTK